MTSSTAGSVRDKHDGALSGALSVRVWLRLLTCSTIVEKRLRRRFAEQFEVTLPRFDAMAALERAPDGLTMSELSRALLVSNGNVTALVRQLQAQEFANLVTSTGDRRSSIVTLTDAGREQFTVMAGAHHAWIEDMLAGMPPAQLELLFGLLAVLKSSIARQGEAS